MQNFWRIIYSTKTKNIFTHSYARQTAKRQKVKQNKKYQFRFLFVFRGDTSKVYNVNFLRKMVKKKCFEDLSSTGQSLSVIFSLALSHLLRLLLNIWCDQYDPKHFWCEKNNIFLDPKILFWEWYECFWWIQEHLWHGKIFFVWSKNISDVMIKQKKTILICWKKLLHHAKHLFFGTQLFDFPDFFSFFFF